MGRSILPFRKNCEGYFFDDKGHVLATLNSLGFVMFPGGGIEDKESAKEGMIRETFEETGAILQEVKLIHVQKFVWGVNWAKTPKQMERYKEYQGDEMFFFIGRLTGFAKIDKFEEDYWHEKKIMSVSEVLKHITNRLYTDIESRDYISIQKRFLENFMHNNY